MRYGVLLVIRLASVDLISAINLFEQNHAHELMGERHLRKAQLVIGAFEHRVASKI